MPKLKIHPIPILKDNYVWTIIDPEKNSALIVDPGESENVDTFLKQNKLQLKGILITHKHWDHTNGVNSLKKSHDVPVFGPMFDDLDMLTFSLKENDVINEKNTEFPISLTVLDIPAHTLGHISYYGEEMLFSGDTLFAAGCGRVFEGTYEQMYSSLQKLAELPKNTKVYCGHEYTANNLRFAQIVEPSNQKIVARLDQVNELRQQGLPSLPALLSEELATNPFLRCENQEIIQNVSKFAKRTLEGPIEVFTYLRKWKDNF